MEVVFIKRIKILLGKRYIIIFSLRELFLTLLNFTIQQSKKPLLRGIRDLIPHNKGCCNPWWIFLCSQEICVANF